LGGKSPASIKKGKISIQIFGFVVIVQDQMHVKKGVII